MEKLVVENLFIKEKEYQKIKENMNKKDDYFCEHEFINFNAIFNATS